MQEMLLIYLNVRHPERPSWAVVDADGIVQRSAYHDSADGFATLAENKQVVVIVPAADVLLTTIKLPAMNRTKLLQAIPFALEDQLTSDVETLHFALGDYQAGNDIPVAVVAREKLVSWTALIKTWSIEADRMIPAVFAVPVSADEWHVMIDEMSMLRTDVFYGIACDNNNLDAVLHLALTTATTQPKQIIIRNYVKEPFAETLKLPSPILEEQVPSEQFMIDAARSIIKTSSINLLQQQYATKKMKMPKLDTMQRALNYLVVALIVLLFLYPLGSLLILSARTSAIKAEVNTIYKKHFPQASNVTAPKIRMEDKLKQLNARINDNRLLLLLGYVGKGMVDTKHIQLKRLDYQGDQLTLELSATTSDDLTTFTEFLTQQGLSVNHQNATLSGTRVNATLQIK